MTKRETVLEHIRVAAFNGDLGKAMRLYVENRVSYAAYLEAVQIGQAQAKAHKGRTAFLQARGVIA